MALNSTDSLGPNQYYRLTNLALGGEFSLDVDNPQTMAPNGSMSLAVSEQVSGQIWQVLELDDTEHYLISSAFLGAKLKLDAIVNHRGDYAPQLRNYTTEYYQTWSLIPHVDSIGNRTTWSIIPDFLANGASGGLALSVYNDSSREPYLAPIIPGSQIDQAPGGGHYQRWLISEEGVTIDDPTFSATHLPALATEAPISPAGEPTVTPTATAVVTVVPSSASDSNSNNDHLTGSLIAAAVVPSAVFMLAVAGLLIYCCLKRRRMRKMQDNSPYSSSGGYSRGGGWAGGGGGGGGGPTSTFMSEILETFHSDETYSSSKRGGGGGGSGRVVELEMHNSSSSSNKAAAAPVPSYLSVLSSNLSGSFRSLSQSVVHGPQDSIASGLASPLSAPPPLARQVGRRALRRSLTINSAIARPDGADHQALLPSPLVPKSPRSPRSPKLPGMLMISEEGGVGRGEGREARARRRSSLDRQVYDCMEMGETRIGQAI